MLPHFLTQQPADIMCYTRESQQLQSGWGGYTIIILDVFSGHMLKILSFLFYKYYTTCRVEQVTQNEPPQELISHITHLHNLLKNLPSSLPSNPGTAGVVHGLKEPDDHNIAMEDDCLDDQDVPSSLVIQEVLRTNISPTKGGANMSEIHVLAARLDESGGLVAATEEEDIWGMEQQ